MEANSCSVASLLTERWAQKNAPVFGLNDTSKSLDELSP
jgi:hypothetical protein